MKFSEYLKERRAYEDPIKQQELQNARGSVMPRLIQYRGWEIENRIHARSQQSTDPSRDISREDLLKFYDNLIDRVNTFKKEVNQEFLVRSRSMNRSMIVNLDNYGDPNDYRNPNKVKQIRVITVLPIGRHRPKTGTKTILIENIEYEVIEIE